MFVYTVDWYITYLLTYENILLSSVLSLATAAYWRCGWMYDFHVRLSETLFLASDIATMPVCCHSGSLSLSAFHWSSILLAKIISFGFFQIYSASEWVNESLIWVGFSVFSHQHITRHFGVESFQSATCNQTEQTRENRYEKWTNTIKLTIMKSAQKHLNKPGIRL